MLHRPWSIVVMSILLGLAGPSMAAFWLSQNLSQITTAWKSINPFFVGFGLCALVAAYGIWKVRPWGYFTYLFLSCASLAYLLFQYVMAADLENYNPLLSASLLALGTCILLQKHISAPYFNPNLRWWERDPRYRVQLGAKFQIDRQTRKGNMLDISRNGCFTELDTKLIVGEEIELRIQLLKFDFTTRAEVIWHSDDPKGYGLRFLGMTRRHRLEIDKIIAYLVECHGERPLVNQGIRPAV